MPLLSQFRALHRGESPVVREPPVPQFLHLPTTLPQLELKSSPAPGLNGVSLSQHYARMAQDLRPSLPSTCHWLDPEDVRLVGEQPIAAGGFANIYEATYDSRKVVLKSYRCYVSFDVVQAVTVRYNHSLRRVHCRQLRRRGSTMKFTYAASSTKGVWTWYRSWGYTQLRHTHSVSSTSTQTISTSGST